MRSKSQTNRPLPIHRVDAIYKQYAKQVLKENPEFWGRYSRNHKMSNFWIYRREYKNGERSVVEVISYPVFREVLAVYFTEAKTVIIEGGEVNLGNNLGVIAARRVERNHKNRAINFAETAKQPKKENGKPAKIIYWTDDDWIRIGWIKSGKIANVKNYAFVPTPDDTCGGGFKAEFSRANMADPLLKYKYRFFPFIVERDENGRIINAEE